MHRRLIIRTDSKAATMEMVAAFGVAPRLFSDENNTKVRLAENIYEHMPRFVQDKDRPYAEFTLLTGLSSSSLSDTLKQKITDKTKSVWFPKKQRGLGNCAWVDESGLIPKHPMYVISKGRPQCITARALDRMGVDFFVVVEPQEFSEYTKRWGNRVITGTFNTTTMSSIPVRNWVDENATSDRYWLIDDNIEDFNVLTDNNKYVCRTPVIFRATEDFCDRFTNVGQAGFNYYSFAKKTEKVPPFYLNTRIYSCTLMYRTLNGVRVNGDMWRGRYNEDTDLSLRILKAGYCTILMNSFLAGKITTQRVTGGNTDSVYTDNDNRRAFAESLVEQHPDVAEVVWKFNRWHHKVNYAPFDQRLVQKPAYPIVDYKLKLHPQARNPQD